MAKKTSKKTNQTSRRRSTRSSSQSTSSGSKFFDKLKDIYDNPAARYIAAGLATAALAKTVQSLSTRYPEITKLLKESLDSFEGKLAEFQDMSSGNRRDVEVDDEISVQH